MPSEEAGWGSSSHQHARRQQTSVDEVVQTNMSPKSYTRSRIRWIPRSGEGMQTDRRDDG